MISLTKQKTKKGAKMNSITVKTKKELKSAIDKKYEEIIIVDSLANQLKKAKPIAFLGAAALSVIIVAVAAMPFTGGASVASIPIATGIAGLTAATSSAIAVGSAAAGAATLSGIEIATIILAASVGITLIVAIFKDYEEISYKDGEMALRRKQK